MLQEVDSGKTSLIIKILFQLDEMMKTSQHQVKHSYYSNMSTILKLNLKCLIAFMPTDNETSQRYKDLKITSCQNSNLGILKKVHQMAAQVNISFISF